MTPGDRLKAFIQHKNITNKGLADSLAINPNYVSMLITGKKELSKKLLHNITNIYHELNIDWLVTGKGEMLTKNNDLSAIENIDPKNVNKVVKFLLDNQKDLLQSQLFIDFLKDCNRELELKKIVEDTESKIQEAKQTLLKKLNKFQE